MNAREKNLVVILAAVVGCGVALFLGVQWFWKPLQDYNKTIADLNLENEKRAAELQTFFKERKKLEVAKLKSLPLNSGTASSEYLHYLETVLRDSGLAHESLTSSATATKVKPPASVPGIKDVGHQTMTFTIRARGELSQLIKAMERLQKTPYEHRIKNLSIDRADTSYAKNASTKLNINMIIETLLVAKTPAKSGLPPGIDPRLVLCETLAALSAVTAQPSGWGMVAAALQLRQEVPTPEDRSYADIARKNIFVGAFASPGKATAKIEEPIETGPTPPEENVPAYVRLNMTLPDQQEAYLRNLVFKSREIKLVARPRSGYEFFRITGEDGEYVFFHAKVLRVDAREIFFQVKNQVYELHIGQSLDEAMRNALSIEKMDELDLFDLFDSDWAKQQMEKDKKSTSKKKSTKG